MAKDKKKAEETTTTPPEEEMSPAMFGEDVEGPPDEWMNPEWFDVGALIPTHYWKPEKGDWLQGELLAGQESTGPYGGTVYVVKTTRPCLAASRKEIVEVPPGTIVGINAKHSLHRREALPALLATGNRYEIGVFAKDKVPTKTAGRTVWDFKVRARPLPGKRNQLPDFHPDMSDTGDDPDESYSNQPGA